MFVALAFPEALLNRGFEPVRGHAYECAFALLTPVSVFLQTAEIRISTDSPYTGLSAESVS